MPQTEQNQIDSFTALSDPTRREILKTLAGRQLSAGEIARRFPQQRPAISKHLGVLRRTGMLIETRYRQQRLYSIRSEGFESLSQLLHQVQVVTTPPKFPIRSVPIEEHKKDGRPPGQAIRSNRFELDFD